jgi:3-deoxy-D-manno-octulosonic-acid transferase
MSGLLNIYEGLVRSGRPFLEYLLRVRIRRGKEEEDRLSERRGVSSRPRPPGKLVWIHAASVGEAQSALILIDAIAKRMEGISVLVTTGTVTSANLMARRLPPFAFHQYVPLDHPDWVSAFLDYWNPSLAFWMESELWPNMLHALKRRGIPCLLINARMSDRSFKGWRRVPSLARSALGCFSAILAQTEDGADKFGKLGAGNVFVTDNLKYSASPLPFDPVALSALRLSVTDRRVWVYASTHKGEEALACRIHKRLHQSMPDLLTIIVPRHPERRNEITDVCYKHDLKFRLRGQNHALPAPDDDIYIADTLGELGLFYSLSPVAVIGRSFSDDGGGGHNPVEAAQLGCAVLTGPNNQNQRQLYDDMAADQAVLECADEESLYAALYRLFSEPEALKELQGRSRSFVLKKSAVIENVMEKIDPYLKEMEGRNAA